MGAVTRYVLPARTIRDWKMDRMADETGRMIKTLNEAITRG